MITLRLGTRRSALALAQSTLVKHALEKAHPNLRVELVGIDTQGDETNNDRYSEMPLDQLDGKNFFVKEIDEALLENRTDLSVHSYKDLSLERPEGITLAAVPPRANPRDIALFHPRSIDKIMNGGTLNLGFSSPRRSENTPRFLKTVLPFGKCEVTATPIRGNVPTRIRKLHDNPELDGIVLALAGLIRLQDDADTRKLLSGLHFMILPLDVCPAAPAQGALAIECRTNDNATRALLKTLHCETTAASTAREREVLKRFGGGCHQAFGATTITMDGKPLTFIHGKSDSGEALNIVEWNAPHYTGHINAWDGSAFRSKQASALPLEAHTEPLNSAVFVAHHRAATPSILPFLADRRIYTSGIKSWQKLAEMGLWVEGCAENLGFNAFTSTLQEKLLQLPGFEHWTILTHQGAEDSWKQGDIVATYSLEAPTFIPQGIATATHLWWASGSQFLALNAYAKQARFHACGPGKTAELLRAHNIEPDIFPSNAIWRTSVNI